MSDTVVIWPIHALAKRANGLPADIEEIQSSVILDAAIQSLGIGAGLLTLPPWRFAPEAASDLICGMSPDLILDAWREVAKGLFSSGARKLVFWPTHPLCEPLCSTAAIDLRDEFGFSTYVVRPDALGIDLGNSNTEERLAYSAQDLSLWLLEIRNHGGEQVELHQESSTIAVCNRQRPIWPGYGERYIGSSIESLSVESSAPKRKLAIVPVGAIEQHGPHLPVGVDAILGEAMLSAAIQHLKADDGIWIAPAVVFGKSNEHAGFPGTLSLSARTLRSQIMEVASKIRSYGFERISLLNTHGGNTAVLKLTAAELCQRLRCPVTVVRNNFKPTMDPHEIQWGLHAGEWETSLMLACAPDCVNMETAPCEYPVEKSASGRLRPERSPVVYAWMTSDISKSGVIGDATRASAANGKLWLKEVGLHLAQRFSDLAHI